MSVLLAFSLLLNVVGAVTGLRAARLRRDRCRLQQANATLAGAYEALARSVEERLTRDRAAMVARVAEGVAREIRTPLGVLLRCFQRLSVDCQPADPRREFVDIGRKALVRAENVLTAFLDFAHPRPGAPQRVDLNTLARTVVERMHTNDRPIDVKLHDAELAVAVDAGQVERAIEYVVLAAAALVSQGAILFATDARSHTARIVVAAAPFWRPLPNLFEPFADHGASEPLALPLARRLIENQGGLIRAEVAGGSLRFVIELPMASMGSSDHQIIDDRYLNEALPRRS